MPRGKAIYDDESKGEEQGRDGGGPTQEDTPDVAETDEEPTA